MRILVGSPTVSPDKRFLDSLSSFLFEASKNYEITHRFIYKKPIYEAQNILAKEAIDGEYNYLLMVEDDNWGFKSEHLDKLINSGSDFCGFPYYSRHFPYLLTSMKFNGLNQNGTNRFIEEKYPAGFHEVDLIGFGFTLFSTRLLKKVEDPIFYPLNLQARATDQWFCMKVYKDFAIRPLACFDDIIAHRDITKENIEEYRNNKIDKYSLFARNLWANKIKKSEKYKQAIEEKKKKAFSLSL